MDDNTQTPQPANVSVGSDQEAPAPQQVPVTQPQQPTPQPAPIQPTTGGPAPEKPAGNALRKVLLNKFFVLGVIIVAVAVLAGVVGMKLLSKDDSSSSAKKAPHIKIGLLEAFSGGSSNMGYGGNKGVQLAKKQLAANNIEVIQEDSQCNAEVAPKAIKRLIDKGVVAIIGDGCSSASFAALPEADKNKVVMISPTASSPRLSLPDDYFFRVIPSDNFQGAFMAKAIYDKGIRTAAVFYTDEPYGQSMNEVFKKEFEKLGGKVVVSVYAESDVIDLDTQVQELKAANPGAVFYAQNSVVSSTAAIKLTREAGITVPLFGADICYDTTMIKNAPEATEGLTVTSFPMGSKKFQQDLLNEYQVTEQLYGTSQAYDAFHAIHLATQRGARTGEQIKNLLPSIKFQGVSAYIEFDKNGEISDPAYEYDLLQIKEGAFKTIN